MPGASSSLYILLWNCLLGTDGQVGICCVFIVKQKGPKGRSTTSIFRYLRTMEVFFTGKMAAKWKWSPTESCRDFPDESVTVLLLSHRKYGKLVLRAAQCLLILIRSSF